MSEMIWKLNEKDECYDLLEIGAIQDDDEVIDAVIAKVYDMGMFIHFCHEIGNESPVFPQPPITNKERYEQRTRT